MTLAARVIDLSFLTASEGFIVQGDVPGDLVGLSVSSAGDVNGRGDTEPDVVIRRVPLNNKSLAGGQKRQINHAGRKGHGNTFK